jgi:RNA polymerase sigma factor (sigma-70 family)
MKTRMSSDEALERLITHRGEILRYAARRLVNRSDAEDLCAETFAVAWRQIDKAPPAGEELFWLYGIARRVLANAFRSRNRAVMLARRLAMEPMSDARRSSDIGEFESLIRGVGHLPVKDREAIQLAYWEELSYEQIGAVLGCSTKAVGIRLARARKQLLRNLTATQPTNSEEKE